jgi:YbbR domain-containing protein
MSENNKKNGKEQKKSFSIGRLFQSNRFVLLFSAFVAIVLWFIMAFNNTENRARVIYDIPIDVTLSDEMVDQDYRIFEQSETTARVSVTGSSLIVNQLSADDIKVSAALSANITRAGTYTLNLTASKNSTLTDYTFDTTYPGSIILFVDKYEEKTFTVEPNVEFTVADGYYASSPTLAENKVTVSGPETEISEIKKVVLEKKLDGALKEPTEFVQSYTFYDKDDNKITNLDHLTISTTETTVKIDVLKRADLPVVATYRNLPDGVDISSIVTVNPDTLKIGRDTQSADDEQKEISLEPVDMSEVNLRNTTFSVDFQLPSNYTNISGVKHAAVKFDLSGYSEETFVVDNFVVSNQADDQQVDLDTTQLEVTVVGPTAQLKKLKASDLYAEIDLSGKEDLVGSVALPAKIHISSKYGSWIYGTYTAYVNITR